jgi:GNAT superfamily N-acetyltransferase
MDEATTQYVSTGFGLGQFSNGDVVAAGGVRTGKSGTPGTVRLRYALYDMRAIARGAGSAEAEFGSCEINVVPAAEDAGWRVEGIVDLKVDGARRGEGLGARTVAALAGAALGGELRVYDVKKSAAGFWTNVGFDLERVAGRLDGRADFAPRHPRHSPSPSP